MGVMDDGFAFLFAVFGAEGGAASSSSSFTIAAAPHLSPSPSSSLMIPPKKVTSGLHPGGPTALRASVFNDGISRMPALTPAKGSYDMSMAEAWVAG